MKKRNKTIYRVLCLTALAFITAACSEVVDLKTENEEGALVVYGRITNGTLGNEISLSRSTRSGLPPRAVSGASIELLGNQGNSGRYIEGEEGTYIFDGSLIGVPGQAYHVRIQLADGTVYESVPEIMPELSARDTLKYVLQEIEEISNQGVATSRFVISIFADTEILDPRPDLFLKWDIEEVYSFQQAFLPMHNFPFYTRNTCYVKEELEQQRVLLYDGSQLRANSISDQRVVDRTIDDDFRGVHYFNYIQQSLTTGAYNFWQGLDRNVNRVGSIFDQPPGALSTNLFNVNDPSEDVLGYFEATAADTVRLKITNAIVDRFFPVPCVSPPEVDFARFMCFRCIERLFEPECLDCLLIPKSTLNRPVYFD
ncbi:MAG: DUF4249 domain-containing protein [Roseivirga sp.]|nr:DUF4249 domain-containing protein [Roseivirga sp.]